MSVQLFCDADHIVKQGFLLLRILQWVLFLLVATGAHADEHATEPQRVLVIGAIHADLEGRYAELRPIADYVAEALGPAGVTRVDILVVEDRRRLAHMLRTGRVDWVSENTTNAVYLQEAAGVEIIARKWKQGAPQVRAVFFTRADNGIESLGDLRGKMLALQRPESTTGHFLPVAALLRDGHRTASLETPRQGVPAQAVGYAFSGSDLNTTTWVHKRIVAAGVLSNVDWESVDSMPESFRKDFVIFHQTAPLPRALELVRGDLDDDLKTALKTTLLEMGDNPAAAGALQAYHGTLRFDELAAEDWAVMTELRSTFAQLMFVDADDW